MSFIWNWWSGNKNEEKKEEEETKDEEVKKEEEKKEEEETKEEEIKKEDKKEEEEEKGESKNEETKENQNEDKDNNGNKSEDKEKENIQSEDKSDKIHHKKESNLSGSGYQLAEEEITEKKEEKNIDNKLIDVKIEEKDNGNNSIKINLNLSKKLSKEDKIDDLKINKEDPLHWKSVVYGPENSPYEKGKFEVSINFEENKQDIKPIIKFLTKIYHYNVKQNNGEIICPNLWNNQISEEENMKKIKLLMSAPDSRYPFSKFIQEEYYNNFQRYKEKALQFTKEYAMN